MTTSRSCRLSCIWTAGNHFLRDLRYRVEESETRTEIRDRKNRGVRERDRKQREEGALQLLKERFKEMREIERTEVFHIHFLLITPLNAYIDEFTTDSCSSLGFSGSS